MPKPSPSTFVGAFNMMLARPVAAPQLARFQAAHQPVQSPATVTTPAARVLACAQSIAGSLKYPPGDAEINWATLLINCADFERTGVHTPYMLGSGMNPTFFAFFSLLRERGVHGDPSKTNAMTLAIAQAALDFLAGARATPVFAKPKFG